MQEYFSFSKYGTKEAALLALIKREEELSKRLKAKRLRSEIPYNMIFDKDENLKGTSFTCHPVRGQLVKMQVTVNGKQKSTSRRVNNNDLIDVFLGLANWRMAKLGIVPCRVIKAQLRSSFKLFERKLHHNKIYSDK
ncbi:hypothetical protein B9J87_09650 [Vibrio sp. V19_P1S1T109]|uniref:hypothetical protein n=1 Tax=unclassified Vibrio TaxID=2614977 RepID=UPI000B8EBA3D|nr:MULTISPECIES: hypothetical protein [unclassified Vibrio]OXX24935.1 hypothetical protein B9J88_04690 [Vibrio sp. V05_P4A8T149]OXX55088.1 hypothetical protein B9J91_10055 [Vibrio sp. V18_P1S4T112]OXX72053.1 hypothetical protein B9J87_09650 [Vibrio sp. V19_P1S1T109]OXX19157.1 hypothetical protein B9J86_16255 [Vibrio sp. V06_P1A73T115]OXX36269.1 hypothetical protein B9J81_06245 [Vibrio sp. V04_P4A5T148]